MDAIAVAVFLVRCTADLLVCETMPSDHLRYAAMQACEAGVSRLVADKTSEAGTGVWMAKCLYSLESTDPRRAWRNRVFARNGLVQTAQSGP